MLLENRIDFLQKYYEDKVSKHGFRFNMPMWASILNADPTNKKIYLQWIINQVFNMGNDRLYDEDLYKVTDALIIYDRIKRQFSKKDINQYKTYRELVNEADNLSDNKSGKEIKKDEMKKALEQSKIVYKGSDGSIIIPYTKEASCILGRGTKWCTAATGSKNFFQAYNKDGPLYVIEYKSKKYQFHLESNSYMDERDYEINEDEPVVAWFFNKIPIKNILDAARIEANGILKWYPSASKQIQLVAVKASPYSISYIQNPSEDVQLAAVRSEVECIDHFKPTEKVQLYAVKTEPTNIMYIENPTEVVQEYVVRKIFAKKSITPLNLTFFPKEEKVSEKIKELCISLESNSIFRLFRPSENLKRFYEKKTGKLYINGGK
jgi:hypothetical protein